MNYMISNKSVRLQLHLKRVPTGAGEMNGQSRNEAVRVQ